MLFRTLCYPDFRRIVEVLFGMNRVVLRGSKPHEGTFFAIAVSAGSPHAVEFRSRSDLPESFAQEFGEHVPISDGANLEWEE
jgi:hypothetical protein